MTKRRALDQCRREVDDCRARPTVVDEPTDDSVFVVWPSIGRQLPPRSTILDMLCFYATPAVRSDLLQPIAFDESAWLADQLVDRVCELVRTWELTTDWERGILARSGRALEWIVWRVATAADDDLAPLYEDEAASPWAIDLDTSRSPRNGDQRTLVIAAKNDPDPAASRAVGQPGLVGVPRVTRSPQSRARRCPPGLCSVRLGPD